MILWRRVEVKREIIPVRLERIDEGDLAFVDVVAFLLGPPVIGQRHAKAYETRRPFFVERERLLRWFRYRRGDDSSRTLRSIIAITK